MHILVLGGTRLVGRAFVEAAPARGHEITLFNRGKTNPERFPELERVVGDRELGHEALRGRRFDAVYDASGYQPRHVADALRVLADSVGFYAFVSTISVYLDPVAPDADESAPLHAPQDPGHYGQLKVLCEDHVRAAMPGRSCVMRPGMVVGPFDDRDRFGGWIRRVAQGGPMLAPGSPQAPMQVIDARDAADFAVRLVEGGVCGAYNLVGDTHSMAQIFELMRQITGSNAECVWVDDDWLKARGLVPWNGVPMWLSPEDHGFARISARKALGAGLRVRPLAETVADALVWERSRGLGLPAWLAEERTLLDRWFSEGGRPG